jgi:hypothetical protein
LGPLARAFNTPFVLLIRLYRVTLSPLVGGQCRYEPTCSGYGLEAYRLHGPVRGSLLTLRRILRCHPFVKGGYDPVPLPEDGTRGGTGGGGAGGQAARNEAPTPRGGRSAGATQDERSRKSDP